MPMEAHDRGNKHRCFKCQTLFYDLKRPQLVCPRCGADQADADKFVKPAAKRTRKAPAPKPAPVVAENEADEPAEDDEPAAKVAADDDDDEDEDDLPDDD